MQQELINGCGLQGSSAENKESLAICKEKLSYGPLMALRRREVKKSKRRLEPFDAGTNTDSRHYCIPYFTPEINDGKQKPRSSFGDDARF